MLKPVYIFAILSAKGDAPSSKKMKFNKEYNFMPFGGNEVYTIDEHIWKYVKGKVTLLFFPTASECNTFFEKALNSNITVLIALTDKPQLEIPGRGLVDFEPYIKPLNVNLVDVGYDVTDLFGLSAITNIGYSSDAFSSILDLNIVSTEYGLISNRNDAMKFTKFADTHVLEHAPFLALKMKLCTSDEIILKGDK